jgi:hypothetical protein
MLEESVTQLTPKDLALVGWSLARTQIPNDTQIFKKLK